MVILMIARKTSVSPVMLGKGITPYDMDTFGQDPCSTCHTFITSADPTCCFSSGYIIKISNNIDVMLKSNNTQSVG